MTSAELLSWFTTGWTADGGIGEGIGFGKAGDGTLTLTEESGAWSVAKSFKVAGGKLEVGGADSSVNMWLSENNQNAGTLEVEGGELVVHGQLGGKDNGLFKIFGGGRVTVNEIVGQTGGHSSGVILGDANDATSIGTLTVTTGITKLHDLTVIGRTDEQRSTVSLAGDLSIWSSRNGYALDVDGGQVTVGGKYYGANDTQAQGTVRVRNGGNLTVSGASALIQNLEVDNGTVTIGQLLDARGTVSVLNSGNLAVNGLANLSGGMSVSGGVATLNGGMTMSGNVTISGGELALGGTVTVSSGTLRLEDGKLTLGAATAALGTDLTLELSLNAEAKLKGGAAGANGRTITLQISADEVDLTRFTENRYHLWDGDIANGVTVNLEQVAVGRGTLSYDSASGDLVLEGVERQMLTWTASGTALTWQSGENGTDQWTNSDSSKQDSKYRRFYDGDSVTFTGDGSAKTVTLGGDVRAWDMAVNSGGWTFDTAGHSLMVSNEFTLGDGASVVFQGTGPLQIVSANVGNGTVTFKDPTISHYGPGTF